MILDVLVGKISSFMYIFLRQGKMDNLHDILSWLFSFAYFVPLLKLSHL